MSPPYPTGNNPFEEANPYSTGKNPFDEAGPSSAKAGPSKSAKNSVNPFSSAVESVQSNLGKRIFGFDEDVEISQWESTPKGKTTPSSMFSVVYYSGYFDISTGDFMERIMRSFLPFRPLLPDKDQLVDNEMNAEPDLYGCLWLTTTLVLVLSVNSNLSTFFRNLFSMQETEEVSNYTIISAQHLGIAAGILYGYVILVPLALFLVRLCSSVNVPFIASLCVYGYSFAPVILGSVICVVPISLVQIISMGVAFAISTWFVFYNLWRDQTVENQSLGYFVRLVSGILHAGLGLVLTSVFFLFPDKIF